MIEIGDPIEVRHGLGTKRFPFGWWAVYAGRHTKTHLYYRVTPDGPDSGPFRLSAEGVTWRRRTPGIAEDAHLEELYEMCVSGCDWDA
ncbi:MAG: hypothetical protein Q7U34_03730 [Anaerolineales bacterium]|nr:hypothetical protein [Anaerolineales bacterium]